MSESLVAELDRYCRASFGPDGLEPWPSAPPIIEARGEGLVSIFYVDDAALAKCPGIPISADGTLGRDKDGGWGFQHDTAPIGPRDIRVTESSGLVPGDPPNPSVAWILGRAGRDISRVEITVRGESAVVASRQGEWFVASWPAASLPMTIVGIDAAGTQIALRHIADEAELWRDVFDD